MKQFGEFELDTPNECLLRSGKTIALPPKPFAVLRYLVEHPERLITHDELLEALWPETYVQPQVLRTYMLDLRKALGDDPGQPRFIQTIPKRGYRFVAPVTEQAETGPRSGARSGPRSEARSEARSRNLHQPPSKPESGPEFRPELRSEFKPELKPKFKSSPAPGSVPQPAAETRIVNREAEIACLYTQFELASNGQRQVVFVVGEAGIGKTALVDCFCGQVGSGSTELETSVARGQCVEGFGRKEEYYPITEVLGQICASPDGERACRILARIAPLWLASIGRECADGAQSAARERMPGDLCAALEELASEKPLVLIFEDLQWADESTLHLISALARRRAQTKLMLLGTCRTQDVSADHPLRGLKQDLRLRRLCTEIALAPLAKPAVRELLRRELQQEELPAGLAEFVHRRSDGNPLFVIAIVEHLMAQHFLTREKSGGQLQGPARWVQAAPAEEMEAGVPEGLAQMIELEIARLSEPEQRMLEAGSLINVAFPAWAVAAALEMDPAEAEEACQDLAQRLYFVERAGQDELPDGSQSTFYVFAHELYREVFLRKQTEARRARRHIRIAERLAELFAGREGNVAREMAMHFEAAGNWQRALSSLRVAARHASERQANVEAAELLEHALRLAENLRESQRDEAVRELCQDLATLHGSRDALNPASAEA